MFLVLTPFFVSSISPDRADSFVTIHSSPLRHSSRLLPTRLYLLSAFVSTRLQLNFGLRRGAQSPSEQLGSVLKAQRRARTPEQLLLRACFFDGSRDYRNNPSRMRRTFARTAFLTFYFCFYFFYFFLIVSSPLSVLSASPPLLFRALSMFLVFNERMIRAIVGTRLGSSRETVFEGRSDYHARVSK